MAKLDPEIKKLLELKTEYRQIAGKDWTPPTSSDICAAGDMNNITAEELHEQIVKQGNLIRSMKANKIEKAKLDPEIKKLLALKTEYRQISGKDWTPSTSSDSSVAGNMNNITAEELHEQIVKQGNLIRSMKANKLEKAKLDPEIKKLLALKTEYRQISGKDWTPSTSNASCTNVSSNQNSCNKAHTNQNGSSSTSPGADNALINGNEKQNMGRKRQTRLGLEIKKEEDLAGWYSQVLTKAQMIEYYDVSGCYIMRPWSYGMWEIIKDFVDKEIKQMGVLNAYFPIFVSSSALHREKTHITDFAPEVAWVTKSGDTELNEPIAVRPTSETVMYPAFSKWIQSYRDLPLRINQWNNVVRWEFKHPTPFLRTREFLWQEGHCVYATAEEASTEAHQCLDLYADVYTKLMAIPVIKGKKTEKEKFAGADWTLTIEAFISSSGRAIQGATSHYLGQNFSKMFDIVFDDPVTKVKTFAHQISWGITTRTLGVMTMVHSDNFGLVLPPALAFYQVVIVPCGVTVNTSETDEKMLLDNCRQLEALLRKNDIRVHGDYRENYSPGWKFNHWELKGVPIRVELGFKELSKNEFVAVRRDNAVKTSFKMNDAVHSLKTLLDDIHLRLYEKAEKDLNEHVHVAKTWNELLRALDSGSLCLSPFCGATVCEDQIKTDSARDAVVEEGAPSMGAKSLCIPFKQPEPIVDTMKCVNPECTREPKYFCLFGRSY